MTTHATPSVLDEARSAMARAIGLTAFVFGYPLIETLRTCRLQTSGSPTATKRADIDALHSLRKPSTDEDRDIVTPANDLLYTTAWIHLTDGPRLLTIPSAKRHPGRYFVLALYDAWTENFNNLGPRNSAAEGETVVLVGPGGQVPKQLAHLRVVQCPTNLVWLIARILVADEADLPAAQRLQDDIVLQAAPGTPTGRRPLTVERWQGEPLDAMAQVWEQQRSPDEVAATFFTHLCWALSETQAREADQGLIAWLGKAGLNASEHFQWQALDEPTRKGLAQGLADAGKLLATTARGRHRKPWTLALKAGRYGIDYLHRAITAYIGLGALATDEAMYAMGHLDKDLKPLTGAQSYRMHFAPDQWPPVDAFWSVTLYDIDRFLYPNALRRHAIGDRTANLRRETDGSLVLDIAHAPPADQRNWLPAPAGPFYVAMRMYHPQEGIRSWRIPPLETVKPA